MNKYRVVSVAFLAAGVLAGAVMAADPIVYSGPDRNVIYDYHTGDTISLFDAAGAWDNVSLSVSVHEDPQFQNTYQFGNLLQVHGNYVQYAVGSDFFDIKRLAYGQLIGAALTYSGNSYKDFSNYRQSFDPAYISESGEFRNASGYAGLRLVDGTNTYYGWLQVAVTNYDNANLTGTLIDWAYNSVPNRAIPAGYTNISPVVDIAHAVAISWPTIAGLVYQLQGSPSLTPPAWTNVGPQVVGNGDVTTQFAIATDACRFYQTIVVGP